MAQIGELYRSNEGKWTGYVATLAFEINLRLDPNPEEKAREDAPAFIVRTVNGKIELGAAWKRTTREGGASYLSMSLDHPGWPGPLNVAAFFTRDNPDHAAIVWNRPQAKVAGSRPVDERTAA